MSEFPTAPRWYRPILRAELPAARLALRLLTDLRDNPVDDSVSNEQECLIEGRFVGERLDPGRSAEIRHTSHHVTRYAWALDLCIGKSVVDLGCGTGYGTNIIAPFAERVIGVDVSEAAVERASELFPHNDYRQLDLVRDKLPVADVGVCFEVLEHLDDPRAALRRFFNAYERVLISFPNPLVAGSHINPHHRVDWPLVRLRREISDAGGRVNNIYRQGYFSPAITRFRPAPSITWLIDSKRSEAMNR